MQKSKRGEQSRWLSLLFICVSLMVISLDNTILNVAIPSISNQLGATATDLQWIVDAYILVFAALLLTMGSIGDRIGRKRSLQFGLLMFGLGSLAAALSTSTGMLIGARAFLGIGGATIMPATLSIVTATFTDQKERSKAIGIWAAVFGLGVGIGPLIGGWLLQRFEWNAVFFINLPVVVVAIVGGYFYIEESKDEHAPSPDIPGVILSIIGLFALVYAIIEAGFHGWSSENVMIAFVAALVFLGAFAIWESRTKNPMLPLGFFRNMSFTGANLALALVTFSLFGAMFFMSQFFQSVQGYTALEAGVRVLPMALVLVVASGNSSRVTDRLGIKWTVALGILLAGTGLFLISRLATADAPYEHILLGLIVLAAGMGTAMPPATDSIMGSIPVNKAGVGSAMNDTTRQLGGAMGVAVLGTVMNNTYLSQIQPVLEIPALQMLPEMASTAIRSSIQGAHIVAQNINIPIIGDSVAKQITDTANLAFVHGMTDAMLVGSFIMFGAVILTIVILPSKIRRPNEENAQVSELTTEAMPAPAIGD